MITFSKILDKISNRHDSTTVFDDFIYMCVCAFAYGQMEEQYMSTVKRYNDEEAKLFGQAMGALLIDYENVVTKEGAWNDLLGEYFMEISSRSSASRSGQFFTPVSLCNMIAQMTQEGEPGETINDPSCGSSRCLVAHARLHPDNRLKCFYHGYDLDRRCVNMSVINYIMHGMKGVVIHMNTLSMEVYGGYRIYLPEMGGLVKPLSVSECWQYINDPERAKTTIEKPEAFAHVPVLVSPVEPNEDNIQLSLF
jgi:type I restriction enzyme M protein